jgi:hypothetical protein
MKNNLETVISQRLNLKTNQQILEEEFGIILPNLGKIKTRPVLNNFKNWDFKKQNRFIKVLGGNANFKKTKLFIENLTN